MTSNSLIRRLGVLTFLLAHCALVTAAPGDLDASFGTGGKLTTAFGLKGGVANSSAVQSDGKIVVAGVAENGNTRGFGVARYLADGTLDASFGTGGKVSTDFGRGGNTANSVAIQSDGKIVVAGESNSNVDYDFSLARYNPDGTLDTTFGTGGKVTTDIAGFEDKAYSLALQSDGKIVAAGDYRVADAWGSAYHIAVTRYNADGSLDTSFGTGGIVTTTNGNYGDHAWSVVIQRDGKIVVGGSTDDTHVQDFYALWRYNANGTLDGSFGNGGKVITEIGSRLDNQAHSLTLQSDGKLVLAGFTWGSAHDLAVVRYQTDGALDTSFGNGGKVTTDFGSGGDEYGSSVAVQSDGKILLAGRSDTSGGPNAFTLVRYLPNGALDAAFGDGGKAVTVFDAASQFGAYASSVVVQSDGNIVVAGASHNGTNYDWAVARYLGTAAPGELDPTFGSGGKVSTSIGATHDRANGLTVQSDGKILVTGGSVNGSEYDIALLRYHADGTLDSAFGNQGKVTTAIGTKQDYGRAVSVRSDGKILVAGDSNNGVNSDFAVLRYNADGTLDTTFGNGGKVTSTFNANSGEIARSMAVQVDSKIVVAGYSDNGTVKDSFALMRFTAEGTLDSAFGNGGKVTTPVGSGDDYGTSIALQRDGKIVLAGYTTSGNGDNDFALVRYNAEGTLDSTFGAGGKVITPLGAYNDNAQGVAVQSDGKIVVAGSSSKGSAADFDFALVRYLADGTLDATFGDGGKVVTDIGSGSDDNGQSVVVQSDGRIVVAGSSYQGGGYDFAVVRYLANGTLDSSFGNGGKITTAVGSSDDLGWSVALQRDGQIVVAGDTRNGSYYDFALVRYAGTTRPEIAVEQPEGTNLADGAASVSFGNRIVYFGPTTLTFTVRNASTAMLTDLAVSKDGVNAGDFTVEAPGATTLAAGNTITFAVHFTPSAAGLRTAAIHITSNDADENPFDIVLTGTGLAGPDITTESPLPSGMVGTPYSMTFTANGAKPPYGWWVLSGSLPAGLTLTTAGVLEGTPTSAGRTDFTVGVDDSDGLPSSRQVTITIVPALKAGDLDPSFGVGGKVITAIGDADDYGYSAALQPDGKIVVAGYAFINNTEDFALARYLPDGSLDPTFGNGGKVTTDFLRGREQGKSVALQADGKILVAGDSFSSGSSKFTLVRYQPDGSLDNTFGGGGRITNYVGTTSFGKSVLVQSDGRILMGGEVNVTGVDFGVARWLVDGSRDPAFGIGGVMTVDLGRTPNFDYPQGAALQPDDKIVVVGYTVGTNNSDFAAVRFLANGAVDTSFGNGGVVVTPFANSGDYARNVVVQPDGKIVVIGEAGRDFGVARYLSNGSLDASFGNQGQVTTAIDRFEAFPRGIALQSNDKIVVAGYTGNGRDNDFAVARYNPDGTLDATFATGGKLMTDFGIGHDRARSVVMQQDGKIVVAGESHNGSNYDFALVRYFGSLEPEITVEQPEGTKLADGTAAISFGAVEPGATPVVRRFTLKNTGGALLSGLAVTKDGANANDFSVGALGTTSLAPGASVTFTVSFSPAALGSRSATLHIASNDADENPFDIALSGIGGSLRPLQAWRLAHFGSPNDSGDGANGNDFDKDGNVNLIEYASGSNPKVPDAASIRPTASAADDKFLYTFTCDARCTDIDYTVQATGALVTSPWIDIATSEGGHTVWAEVTSPWGPLCEVTDTGTGLRRVTIAIRASSFGQLTGFLRVHIAEKIH